jgi:UDPglucose--hexose-1-phosphate uridylyltransferase
MEKAKAEYALTCSDYPDVEADVVHWPMSVLRLSSKDSEKLVNMAVQILSAWREYSDPEHEVLAYSTDENGNCIPHNTITPIARRKADGRYELDLVLRNNRTSAEHPLGIFHPHKELHHIKKENIGLIEVMGLFILPGRLQKELGSLEAFLTGEAKESVQALDDPKHPLNHHSIWMKGLVEQYGTNLTSQEAKSVLEKAVGAKCQQVLTDAGVFKVTEKGREGIDKFLKTVGFIRR